VAAKRSRSLSADGAIHFFALPMLLITLPGFTDYIFTPLYICATAAAARATPAVQYIIPAKKGNHVYDQRRRPLFLTRLIVAR
jgi:hypothetical protein